MDKAAAQTVNLMAPIILAALVIALMLMASFMWGQHEASKATGRCIATIGKDELK